MDLPLETSTSPLQKRTVLIIDDDPLFQEELTGALVHAGYDLENAYDGDAGLQSILKEAPDLVVLDLILPQEGRLQSAAGDEVAGTDERDSRHRPVEPSEF